MKKISVIFIGLILCTSLVGCTQSTKTTSTKNEVKKENKQVQLPIEKEQNGIKVKLTKVEQDSDSLKIYVTYTNNSKEQLQPNRADDKVVDNGKQLNCDPQFNLDRVEKLKLAHADYMEPGTSADDVILFTPAQNEKINIALYPSKVRFSFENIPVVKK